MTTTEMASRPTSEATAASIAFADRRGAPISQPREWEPALILIPAELDVMADVAVTINGRSVDVEARSIAGRPQLVAVWDRAGPGWYDIDVDTPTLRFRQRIRIESGKISSDALGHLLADLEFRLPVAIAIALRDGGAKIGIILTDPAEQTLATEMARLRRAVNGVTRPGLVTVLEALADDPHRMLINVGEWVRRERARRPSGADLVQSLWRAGNFDEDHIRYVLDRRVEHTVDLYENRLLKAFADEVERRLRRVLGMLAVSQHDDLEEECRGLLRRLVVARRGARFLNDVGRMRVSPDRVTMVLLKRKEYRATYEAFLEFRRRTSVHLDEPALASPLRNLPYLYQVWGALLTIEAAIAAGSATGYRVVRQQLVWPQLGGVYLKVLKDNQAAVVMRNAAGDELRVFSERSYSQTSAPLRSISFKQRPDVALELRRTGEATRAIVFDPKYKLDSETGAEPGDGTPKKDDIDKMHAYRDAIRDTAGRRVVDFAATLYPGDTTTYGDDVAALRMYPGEEDVLHRRVLQDVALWLGSRT